MQLASLINFIFSSFSTSVSIYKCFCVLCFWFEGLPNRVYTYTHIYISVYLSKMLFNNGFLMLFYISLEKSRSIYNIHPSYIST